MKTQSLYPQSLFQTTPAPKQVRSYSISTRKKVAIAVVSLTICGVSMWAGVELALRLTSGAR